MSITLDIIHEEILSWLPLSVRDYLICIPPNITNTHSELQVAGHRSTEFYRTFAHCHFPID
jgi:hypothetical protein